MNTIDVFYQNNNVDSNFDEVLHKKAYPETENFYQPYCRDNFIDEKHRLYYHYYHYVRTCVRALISNKHKFILLWTPKAGCTSAKHIFYEHEGIINKEEKTFEVHRPFAEKFEHEKVIIGSYNQKLIDNLTIQIVRNPYQRSVSSFFAFKMHKLKNCPLKDYDFGTYLQSLQNQSIKACEHCWNHSVPQFMTEKVDEIIKLENIELELIRVNAKYGLNFKNIIYDAHSHKKNTIITQNYDINYENYFTQENLNLINQIYQKDIEFFKYQKR